MFKHPKCGGTHSTVAEARTCEQRGGVITQDRPATTYTSADGNVEIQVRQPAKHTPAQSVVLDRLRSQQRYTVNGGEDPREPQYRVSINAPRRGYVRWASPEAEKYARDLVIKKAWYGVSSEQANMVMLKIGKQEKLTAEEASYLISELKPLPYRNGAVVPAGAPGCVCHVVTDGKVQPCVFHPTVPTSQGKPRLDRRKVQELKTQVPDGRYAVDLPDGDKVKFFAVRTRKGSQFFTITHHVSDDRFPVAYSNYEKVLQAIVDATPAAAGKRYAEEYGVCFKCGRSLTDTDNPYKPHGLGPDCGPKVMG